MKARFAVSRFAILSVALVLLLGAMSAVGVGHVPQAMAQTMAATMPAITKQIKIALVAPSAKNDLAWTQSMYDALVKVQTAAGGPDKIMITASENLFQVPDAAAAMRDYASQGYDIVIAHGTQYGASMFEVAKDFPDISFAWGTATDTGTSQGLKNVFAYEARAEEGGYVNGVMASLLSKSGVVGIVGPVEAGDASLYINGFIAGEQSTGKLKGDPQKMKIYTNNFGDTALAAQAAKTLISQGADVLTGSAQQVPGAITEIQKVHGFWFGTQSDQTGNWADTVVASQVYDWTGTIEAIIADRLAGKVGGEAFSINLKGGGEKIVFNPKLTIPDDVKKAGQDAADKITSGALVVVGNPSLATPAATMAGTASK